MTLKYRMGRAVWIVLLLLQLTPFSADAVSSPEIKRQIAALQEQKKEIAFSRAIRWLAVKGSCL